MNDPFARIYTSSRREHKFPWIVFHITSLAIPVGGNIVSNSNVTPSNGGTALFKRRRHPILNFGMRSRRE